METLVFLNAINIWKCKLQLMSTILSWGLLLKQFSIRTTNFTFHSLPTAKIAKSCARDYIPAIMFLQQNDWKFIDTRHCSEKLNAIIKIRIRCQWEGLWPCVFWYKSINHSIFIRKSIPMWNLTRGQINSLTVKTDPLKIFNNNLLNDLFWTPRDYAMACVTE